jgi:hypothetical protein
VVGDRGTERRLSMARIDVPVRRFADAIDEME